MRGPAQEPAPLAYLQSRRDSSFDINLEVSILAPGSDAEDVVCRSNFKHMYWNICQQLAHHTVGGCNINPGDLMASGTISGPEKGSFGSMLEISWKGTRPITMGDGSERKFLADGDMVIMRGHACRNGLRIGFGEVTGTILPAH